MNLTQPVSSTSPSGGNQVDGLPPASSIDWGQSGATHADNFDHVQVVLEYVCIVKVLGTYNTSFMYHIQDSFEANNMTQ